MKKIIASALTFILIFMVSCAQNEPIKVGFVAGLTGTNSELGVSGMYGAMLAIDEVNKMGGMKKHKLELVIKDDQGDPNIGIEVDKELVEEDCVAIIGHMTSNMVDKSIPYINKQKILMISPTIALASTSNQNDYFFRLIPSTMEQAKQFSLEIEKLGIQDVLIVSSLQNDIFAKSIYSFLSSSLTQGKITSEMLEPIDFSSQADVEATVRTIISSKAEALVIIASADAVVKISHALDARDEQKTVFLPAWSMTNDLLQRGGSSVEQYYGISFIDYQNSNPVYEDFRIKYFETYGEEPTFASVMSYESVMVLFEAMNNSPDFKSEHLKQQIVANQTFEGLQGNIRINEFGDATREIYMYRIVNNSFVKVNVDE
jgi:branched-chain amino acid transport system substrate-binding protein